MEPSMGASPATELPSLGSSIAVSLVSLGIVCLLAYFALRWLSRKTTGVGRASGPLRVLARQNLDPRRSVLVLEAAGRCFLVGAGDSGMSLLAELDRETMLRELEASRAPKPAFNLRFGEVLSRVMAGRAKPGASAPGTVAAAPSSLPAAPGEG
ncbi:MAG TPA: flagellar biosynthetic protein FliO [Polyangia bacterium]